MSRRLVHTVNLKVGKLELITFKLLQFSMEYKNIIEL